MTVMLEARGLVKHFGAIRAVDGISFKVEKGEVLGFLGPNGAGKTTTMKMLTGYLGPTSGQAFICGQNVNEEPLATKRRLGYLPEGAPGYSDMTPRSFLEFIAAARGLNTDRKAAIQRAGECVHLASVWDQPIETLSKGFRRRVGLAQALIHDPDILILDEPTDGLDPNQKHEVRALIRNMASEKAIIISTHMLEEVDAICSRAIIIDRGRIVADGHPDELKARSRYRNAVTLVVPASGAEQIEKALAALEEISDASRSSDGDRCQVTAFAEGGKPILAEVNRLVALMGWAVEEISVDEGRLDDVFRSLTHSDAVDDREAASEEAP